MVECLLCIKRYSRKLGHGNENMGCPRPQGFYDFKDWVVTKERKNTSHYKWCYRGWIHAQGIVGRALYLCPGLQGDKEVAREASGGCAKLFMGCWSTHRMSRGGEGELGTIQNLLGFHIILGSFVISEDEREPFWPNG